MTEQKSEYSWQSPFDETDADLPERMAVDALIKFKNGAELSHDERGLVEKALMSRPDLVLCAGIEEGENQSA